MQGVRRDSVARDGFVRDGFVGQGFVGEAFVGGGLVGEGLVGEGLAREGLAGGGRAIRWRPRSRWPLRWVAVAALLACATPPVTELREGEGGAVTGYRHERLGYRLDPPEIAEQSTTRIGGDAAPAPAARWDRIEIDGSDLAFRREPDPGVTTMAVSSHCGGTDAPLRVLSSHLLLGIGRREVLSSGPAVVAGRRAWVQWVEAGPPEDPTRIKTVTTRLDGCLVDWTLASTGDFDPALPEFDRWWSSFEPPPPPEAPSESGS